MFGHNEAAPCQNFCGIRGCGKSALLECELFDRAVNRRGATVLFDRPGTSARRLVAHAVAAGLEATILFEQAMPEDGRYLSIPFVTPSTANDSLQRANANEIADEDFCQPFYGVAGQKDVVTAHYTKRYLSAAAAIYRSQPVIPPIRDILKLFQTGSPDHQRMMRQASERWAVDIFRNIECVSRTQYEIQTGPAQRRLSIVKSPALWARQGNWTDWKSLLLAGTQIYVDTSMVSAEVARALTIFLYTYLINLAKEHFRETGDPLPLLIALEEAGALGLVTPKILTTMQEDRQRGISVALVTQTVNDYDRS